ncbi:GtrA family protein [Natronomonas sp. EA1]|uniref:GtrA family protein n=1 Tax=Natronomonas sp. EA1 TaxID=3421655 RepID=UPI003EC1298B
MSWLQRRLRALVSAGRFGQFVSVGVVGAICDNTMLVLLTATGASAVIASALGVPSLAPEVAKFAGIETAIVVMFLLNDRFTFAEQGGVGIPAFLRRLATSNVVRVGGITVQLVVFSVVYRGLTEGIRFGGFDVGIVMASVAGIGAGMLVNYIAESLVTWRVHESR